MTHFKSFTFLALIVLLLGPVGLSAQTPANTTAGPLSEEQLSDDLEQILTTHFNLDGELQLQLLRPWSPPQLLANTWTIEISDYPQVATASMLLRCRLLADGVPAGDYTLTMKAMLWGDGWAARQRLAHGATFDPALLDLRRVDFLRDREVLPAGVGDETFIFERSVNAGRLLTWRDIKRRPLVRKGEVVEVSATDGMLVITMKAIALQNGAQGEAVTVRNQESRRDFMAFVVDESRVQVRF